VQLSWAALRSAETDLESIERPKTFPAVPKALLLCGTFLLILGAVHLAVLFVMRPRVAVPELPRLGTVPAFSFTRESGEPATQSACDGHVWIADFIFLHCAGTCPQMTAKMAALCRGLEREPDIRMVSFDVDPERDSLADLSAYAKTFDADPKRWSFLRGDKAQVWSLAREGFKMGVVEGNAGDAEPILHSTSFVLVDRTRTIRGYYDATDAEALVKLVADAKNLAK
jgi:protein SCO1/2